MERVIATRKLMYAPRGTTNRKELTIRIGVPYWVEEGVAACPVEWDGLFEKEQLADARGMDLLQALHFAADIDPLLDKLRAKYDFYWPSGEPYFDGESTDVAS
jgi:hypothetical protein